LTLITKIKTEFAQELILTLKNQIHMFDHIPPVKVE